MSKFKSLFSSSGRATRTTYWLFSAHLLLVLALGFLTLYLTKDQEWNGILVLWMIFLDFYLILAFIVSIITAVKRCHDRNHEGYYLFLYFVPFANLWMLFELAFLRGTRGPNNFGPDPLEPELEPVRKPPAELKPALTTPSEPARSVEVPVPSGPLAAFGLTPASFTYDFIGTPAYASACLTPRYTELPEPSSSDDPDFEAVGWAFMSRDYTSALAKAEALAHQFPTRGAPFEWLGNILMAQGQDEDARELMLAALEKAARKYALCGLLAELELKAGQPLRTIFWWAQAIHGQESLWQSNFGSNVTPYLSLYYLADGFKLSGINLRECPVALLTRVDLIDSRQIRLTTQAATRLRDLSRQLADSPVPEVVRGLVMRYILAERRAGLVVDKIELSRLIFNLKQDNFDTAMAAVKRLAEIGDPYAILPLLNSINHMPVIGYREEVLEAVRKIREANQAA